MIDRTTYKKYFLIPPSSRKPGMEEIEMKANRKKQATIKIIISSAAAFLAALLLSNGICYAATGETWIGMIFNYKYSSGNGAAEVEIYADENGSGITASAADGPGYSVFEDGRTYFIFDDIKEDITDDISNGNYYKYEYTDDENVRHVIIVGEGYFDITDDEGNTGYHSCWMELFYTPEGGRGGIANTDPQNPNPIWLQKANADYPLYHTEDD